MQLIAKKVAGPRDDRFVAFLSFDVSNRHVGVLYGSPYSKTGHQSDGNGAGAENSQL